MSVPMGFGPVVIPLDLRGGAAELDSAQALRAHVARLLARAGQPEPEEPLFLVTDTPAGLTERQRQYELITAYRAVDKVSVLVLLVGSAPGADAGEDEAFGPDRRLLRPAVLRNDRTAILWAGDLRSARTALEQPAPDDPGALSVLVDVLSVPDVYRRVLTDLAALPDAVAAPGVRLLEQDLPPDVRDRAWRDALTRFAGRDTDHAPPSAVASGADLPEPLKVLASGRGGRDQRHRQPGGPADDAYQACADALDYADEALAGLGTLPGLLRPARRAGFEADLDHARQALDAYQALVGRALRSGTGSGTASSTAEAAAQLTALGLRLPTVEGMRDRIGEGLREYAGKLLGQGLDLRSMAQRFTALAGRVEPVPGSALLPKLAAFRSDAVARESGEPDDPVRSPAAAGPVAAVAGLLGALWQGPLLALAFVVPLLFLAVSLLGASRLRGAGRPGRWAVGPQVAAWGGALTGALVAYAAEPAPWLGTSGLLLGLCAATETARRLWRGAADAWAPGHATRALRQALHGLDALLAKGVREHWAVEERLNCADAARSVAGVLRATAAAAEAEAVTEPDRKATAGGWAGDRAGDRDGAYDTYDTYDTYGDGGFRADGWLSSPPDAFAEAGDGPADAKADDDWMSAYAWPDDPSWDDPADATDPADAADHPVSPSSSSPSPSPSASVSAPGRNPVPPDAPRPKGADATPRWLDRETAEGGPELVATLTSDLADATMEAMRTYWGAVERGQAGNLAATRIEARVAELLSTARRHLRRNGVLAAPPFPTARTRPTPPDLLGTDPQGLAGLVGAETERQAVVQLSSPEQGALLSRDPAAAVWIRFAPLAVRDAVEKVWRTNGSSRPEDVEWTSSGRYAGLLRLTPLRPGVVDTFRPRHNGDSDGNGQDGPYDGTYDRGDGDRW